MDDGEGCTDDTEVEAADEGDDLVPEGHTGRYFAQLTVQHREGSCQVTGPQRETFVEAEADGVACEAEMKREFRWRWEERQGVSFSIVCLFFAGDFSR